MANEINTGADKLVSRILAEAQQEADRIDAESAKEVAGIRSEGELAREKRRAELSRAAEKRRQEILDRCRTNAELDARKQQLLSRRELLSEAFDKAHELVVSLPENERKELLKKHLLAECEGGEEILPAEADRARIQALLPEVNEELGKTGRAAAVLSGESIADEGGFLLRGSGYDKDCSFAALLREARESEESRVAAILFG